MASLLTGGTAGSFCAIVLPLAGSVRMVPVLSNSPLDRRVALAFGTAALSTRVPALEEGGCDLVLSGHLKCASLHFTKPHYHRAHIVNASFSDERKE